MARTLGRCSSWPCYGELNDEAGMEFAASSPGSHDCLAPGRRTVTGRLPSPGRFTPTPGPGPTRAGPDSEPDLERYRSRIRLAKYVNGHTQRADRRLAEGFAALGQAASPLHPVITRNLGRAELSTEQAITLIAGCPDGCSRRRGHRQRACWNRFRRKLGILPPKRQNGFAMFRPCSDNLGFSISTERRVLAHS